MAGIYSPNRGNWNRVHTFLIGFLMLPLGVTGCSGEEEQIVPPVRAIKWMRISETAAEQQRKISGVVKAGDTTNLSFEVGGFVSRVNAHLGDHVRKGQVLAQLDQQPFMLAVRDAESALASSKAEFEAAKQNFQRTKLLYEAANTSQAELDESRARADSARSQIRATKARLELVRRDLRKSVLHAPFHGSISVREIEPFEQVPPGKAVFVLDSEARMKVEVQVPETLISRVKRGQEVEVRFPTMNNLVETGEITEVGTRAVAGNAFPVKVILKKTVPNLRPGMTAEVAFTFNESLEAQESFMIPIAALLAGPNNQHFMFTFDEASSIVTKTLVQVHELRDNNVEIASGIQAGDIVATAGVEFLADRQKVTLLKSEEELD